VYNRGPAAIGKSVSNLPEGLSSASFTKRRIDRNGCVRGTSASGLSYLNSAPHLLIRSTHPNTNDCSTP
jgi:hypothetical protein